MSRPRNRKIKSSHLAFERLEVRTLLAGTLMASNVNGNLNLVGTDAAEEFQIQPQAAARSFKVIGLNNTKINGATETTFIGVNSFTFNLGGGDDRTSLDSSVNSNFSLSSSFTFNGGDGNNSLELGGLFSAANNSVMIGGNLSVTGGRGNDSVTIQSGGGTMVEGFASFDFGNGDSNLSATRLSVVGRRGLRIAATQGDDTIRLGSLSVTHDVNVTLGTGDGTVTVNGNTGIFSPIGMSRIGGRLSMSLNNGDGSLTVDNDLTVVGPFDASLGEFGSASFGSGVTMVMSLDLSARNLSVASQGMLHVHQDASFRGINGAVVDLNGGANFGRDLTWRGGAGGLGNRFSVDSFSNRPLIVGRHAHFFSGRGFNEITIASSATQPGSSIGGNLRVAGNSGTDEVLLDNLQIKGNVDVSLGTGDNRLAFGQGVGPVILAGSLMVQGGMGRDNVQFLNATVAKNTSISLGDGADSVNVGDSVFNAFNLSTGNGDDAINLEPAFFGSQGSSRFQSVVNINTGGGNDSLRIGTKTDPKRSVTFAARSHFRGGVGLNNFNSVDAFFAGTPQFFDFQEPS